MHMAQVRREGIPVMGLLLFALLWFTGTEVLFPHYFLWNDNSVFFLPSTLFNFETLRNEHVVPIINFFQFAGWNHLHAGQSGVLYPPAYVAAWIASVLLRSPLLTIDILSIGHLTAGMLGMYAWLRLLGAKRGFAMGGALLYLTLPFTMILSKFWVVVSYTHCFLPVCFFLLERCLRCASAGRTAGYIAVKTLYILQGYPQYIVYLSLFELLYIAIREKGSPSWRPWISYISMNAAAVIFGLPQLLPMAEATLVSIHRQTPFSLEEAVNKYLSISDFLLNQIIPYQRHHYGDTNIYLMGGSLFLPWITYTALNARKRFPAVILKMALLCMIALLLSTPLYMMLSWLPVISHFRWPFKVFIFAGFFYVPMAVLLLQWMHEQQLLRMKYILCMALFALFSHTIILPSPLTDGHRISNIRSPLTEFSNENFRMIGVSTSDIRKLPSQYETLPSFNYPSIWRIPVLTGYDPLISSTHANINTRLTNLSGIFEPSHLPSIMDHLSRWSVRYVASREALPEKLLEQTSLQKISSDASVIMYENPDAFPVAAFEKDPMQPIPIEYRANRVRIHTAGTTGTLFVRIAPLQGYRKVNPDGLQEHVTLVESGVLLSLQDPQEFVDVLYRSKSFEWGLAAATLGLLAAAALCIWNVAKPRGKASMFA